jgi:glucokinase
MTEDVMSGIANIVGGCASTSKAELVRATRLPRSTVSTQVDWLLNRGVLARVEELGPLRRGRPADSVALNGRAGRILAVEMGVARTTAAVVDLAGRILARRRVELLVSEGPSASLEQLAHLLEELAVEATDRGETQPPRSNWVASIAFPARIDVQSRTPLRPTVMPASWDRFQVGETLEASLGCPVILENDCAVRALGEAGHLGRGALPLISVQIGTGIGAGLIDESGQIYHGANGSAGDVGHIPSSGGEGIECACGARGCVEAVAAVPAMLRRLQQSGVVPKTSDSSGSDVLAQLLSDRNPEAIHVVRESAELVGEVVATLCNILNPRRVVITSALSSVSHELLAAVRSVVYTRARPLATKDLVIDYSSLGDAVGIAGAYLIGRQHLLSPRIIQTLRTATPNHIR